MTEETAGTPLVDAFVESRGITELSAQKPGFIYGDLVILARQLEREVAALTAERDELKRLDDITMTGLAKFEYKFREQVLRAETAEAQRDELQKRIGYAAVPVAEGGATPTASGRALLEMADVFYGPDEDSPESAQTLNMNDVWGWAIAWGEYVPDDRLSEVAALFRRYGDAGLLYWVSEQHEQMRSEFEDVNRRVDFVRQEERLRKEIPSSTERAYKKISYTLPTLATGTAQATECETNETEGLRAELDAAKRALAELQLAQVEHDTLGCSMAKTGIYAERTDDRLTHEQLVAGGNVLWEKQFENSPWKGKIKLIDPSSMGEYQEVAANVYRTMAALAAKSTEQKAEG